jgi:hypothetical protein
LLIRFAGRMPNRQRPGKPKANRTAWRRSRKMRRPQTKVVVNIAIVSNIANML